MKKLVAIALMASFIYQANAQNAENSVKTVINKLFTAMKNGDATMLSDCFADSAILQTIAANGQVRNEVVADFVKQVSSLPKGDADERITFDVVKVDANLAIAWAPYSFYYKGNFSHCG